MEMERLLSSFEIRNYQKALHDTAINQVHVLKYATNDRIKRRKDQDNVLQVEAGRKYLDQL